QDRSCRAPTHNVRYDQEGFLGFQHPRTGCVPKIMEPAPYAGTFYRRLPRVSPQNWFSEVGPIRCSLTIHAPPIPNSFRGKDEMFGFAVRKLLCPSLKDLE